MYACFCYSFQSSLSLFGLALSGTEIPDLQILIRSGKIDFPIVIAISRLCSGTGMHPTLP